VNLTLGLPASIRQLRERVACMKLTLAIFALITLTANADERTGQAMEYHCQGSNYLVIATTDSHAFLDLRACDDDKVVQSVALLSRYMPPEFEVRDIVADDELEFLVRIRGGGTGIAETHLIIYRIIKNKITELGNFVVEHESDLAGSEETIKGDVTFPEKNQVVYRYTQVVKEDGKTNTNKAIKTFVFNSKSGKLEEKRTVPQR